MRKYEIDQTEECLEWFEQQSLKTQSIISKRIKNIIEDGHLGISRISLNTTKV